MFIPVHAKADITEGDGRKKGKLTPSQSAQLNAWCLASKTGILDCLEKCIAIAGTPVNNKSIVTFKSGYVVICGRLVECEDGTQVEVQVPTTGEVNGSIILRYNLSASQEGEFKVTTKVGGLVQQDLNSKEYRQVGIYEFELYKYKATSTQVTLTRSEDYVPDLGGKFAQFEASLMDKCKPLNGYDTSKGTIEERLTRLGFKSGVISFAGSNYGSLTNTDTASNGVFRQGNYVFCNVYATINNFANYIGTGKILFTLPENFRPVKPIIIDVVGIGSDENTAIISSSFRYVMVELGTDGKALFKKSGSGTGAGGYGSFEVRLNFGFEAPPITN